MGGPRLLPPFADSLSVVLGVRFAFDLRDGAQALLPDIGATTVLARWHELATALCEMERSEREVQQLLDSIGEVHSNMSSTDDVIVVSHARFFGSCAGKSQGRRRTCLDVAGFCPRR